jgi:hypothetical protein
MRSTRRETKTQYIRAGHTVEIRLMDGAPALQGIVLGITRQHRSGQSRRPAAPLSGQSDIHLAPRGAAHPGASRRGFASRTCLRTD